MKNEFLIPQPIADIGEKLARKDLRHNERQNYIFRLMEIRDFCNELITKEEQSGTAYFKSKN